MRVRNIPRAAPTHLFEDCKIGACPKLAEGEKGFRSSSGTPEFFSGSEKQRDVRLVMTTSYFMIS